MPTDKPRVTVTLKSDLYQLLTDYAEALGVTRSTAAAYLIETGWNGMIDVVKDEKALRKSKAAVASNPALVRAHVARNS